VRQNAIRAEARLRAKSQLTIPESVVAAVGIGEGDRFMVEVVPEDPDLIRLHRIRSSYAGALRGAFGDAHTYLENERASWNANDRSAPSRSR
jgi:bifunctional DNA-binding transcriptional regulator/antitoxin component of YhaV-PrlF toxin-antitoxin module